MKPAVPVIDLSRAPRMRLAGLLVFTAAVGLALVLWVYTATTGAQSVADGPPASDLAAWQTADLGLLAFQMMLFIVGLGAGIAGWFRWTGTQSQVIGWGVTLSCLLWLAITLSAA